MTKPFRSTLASAVFPVLGGAMILAASGCSSSDDGPAPGPPGPGGTPSAEFTIKPNAAGAGNMAFVPARDTVQVGQIVRLRNGDTTTHQIEALTAGGPSWGTIAGGQVRDRTAANAGTFTFECKVSGHNMSGVLVVLP